MAFRTCPQSGWTPASARVRPPDTRLDTVSADQSLLRTPDSGWSGAGHGGPLDRPVGRTPGPWDRQADGSGPRPDGGGQRTPPAPSVRPCVRSAGHGQPHGLHVLALTGQDGTADTPFGTPSRSQHRDLSGVTPAPVVNAGTSASLVPVRCPRGRVRRPPWTPRSDRRSDTVPPGRVRPDTVHCTRTPWRTAGDADRERTNGTAGVRTCSIATTPRRPARTRRAPHVGPAFAAGQPRFARRWQDRQRDRNHGSDQAAGWCRSTVQAARRRTAVLRRLRVERRANGEASSVMTSGQADAGWFGRGQRWSSSWAAD
jgi:hypothetical protein